MQIGPKLASVRKAKGMTQTELGERCGLDQRAINRMESPGYNPTWMQIMRIFAGLEITPAEFFGATIPLGFSKPNHAELHEKLQEILESGT